MEDFNLWENLLIKVAGNENSSWINRLEFFLRIFQLQDPIFLKKDSVGINIIASNLGPFFATVRASAWPCLASILTRLRLFPGIHNGSKAVMKSHYDFCNVYYEHVFPHCFFGLSLKWTDKNSSRITQICCWLWGVRSTLEVRWSRHFWKTS